ncbi:SLAP domain-containing protein [Lactobacillus sp. ESL0228]|uniref:SLAP domain-containing protein n=1 Tax=Lactobacillus sp. ESL0228 TaxID=2069352 RepID=UPI000EFBE739|nr:SLAP domain-containing protein [Lactobacillus sp. ESL0228]RMC49699.1 hypothetical protein F5ESL0228_02965 [Lactobacillus sp. ESL0228]
MSKSNFNKKMIVSVAGAALLSIGFAGVSGQENAMSATTVSAKAAKNKVVGVNSAVYKKVGKKAVKTSAIVRAGSRVTIYGKKTIKGVTYYEIGKGQYIKAANVDGKVRKLAKSASLYTRNGKAIKGSKMIKGKKVRIFGKAITIHGKKFYATKRGYIPAKAFAVKQAPVDDITPTNPATPITPPASNGNGTNNGGGTSNGTGTNNGSGTSNGNGTNNGGGSNINPPANGKDATATKAESYKDIENAVMEARNGFANAVAPIDADEAIDAVQQAASDAEKEIDNAKTSSEMVSIKDKALAKIKGIVSDFAQKDAVATKAESYKDIENAVMEARNDFGNAEAPINADEAIHAVQQAASEAEKEIDNAKTSSEMVSIKDKALAKINSIVNDFNNKAK